MKISPSTKSTRVGGFTLMELLVVITIILVLAGMTYPVARGVQVKAQKTAVENEAISLKNSIASYYTEYRRYPVEYSGGGDQQVRTDNELMDVLLGADNNKLNPRKTVFFSGKAAKRGVQDEDRSETSFRSGIVLEAGGKGILVDAWGNYYRVRMDTDNNGRTSLPAGAGSAGIAELPESIMVWSWGDDGKEGPFDSGEGKDVTTW